MKCPLKELKLYTRKDLTQYLSSDCDQEECAIYHDGLEDCGIFLIQEYLALILAQLVNLVEKMPSPEFFKR